MVLQLGYFPDLKPGAVAAELDFLSVHVYPEESKITEAVAIVEEFAAAGKPSSSKKPRNSTPAQRRLKSSSGNRKAWPPVG